MASLHRSMLLRVLCELRADDCTDPLSEAEICRENSVSCGLVSFWAPGTYLARTCCSKFG